MSETNTNNANSEEKILKAVKTVLTHVIKDTATAPGMKHPLSDQTIQGLRDCLVMITQREQELDAAAGRVNAARPHFTDELKSGEGEVVVSLDAIRRQRNR
ncbi:segregation and condensation protein A [Ectothiorhodospiraceae bacterium BW-2]|nr:segregation and condensation protein A [Ectothiorhodospiraceae bacterium BW-2]